MLFFSLDDFLSKFIIVGGWM